MKYRYLGSTGLSVSELCFGAMTFGEKGPFSARRDATGRNSAWCLSIRHTIWCTALDAGINFFDTADCYKNGQGEELLGNALKGKRQQVIIGTKGRWQTDPNPNALGASRYHIINAVDARPAAAENGLYRYLSPRVRSARTALEDTLRTLDALILAPVYLLHRPNCRGLAAGEGAGDLRAPRTEKFCVYQAITISPREN